MNNNLLKDLEKLINDSIDKSVIPYVKGRNIYIGKMIVRPSRWGYAVFDTSTNSLVDKTFCKTSAVALAKSLAHGKNFRTYIKELDNIISKQYNDCLFYKHTINSTDNEIRKEVAEMRYEIAREKTDSAKQKLDTIIFSC